MAVAPTKRRPSLMGGKRKRRGFSRLSHQRARPYSQRKRNYSKHLRLLWVCCSFPPSLGPPSLPPAHTQGRSFFTLLAATRRAPIGSFGQPPLLVSRSPSSVRKAQTLRAFAALALPLHLRRDPQVDLKDA